LDECVGSRISNFYLAGWNVDDVYKRVDNKTQVSIATIEGSNWQFIHTQLGEIDELSLI
jgi:hypothetical protein